jgi:general stress protein 26
MSDSPEDHVWAMVQKQRIAMLTTEDEDGKLVSRPMACLARPEENRIYFVTRLDAKVGEIGGSAAVNLAFSDPHNNSYLSISATARTSQDREKLKELWSMFTEAWLPQGPEAEDVALITIEPEDAKLWDSTSSSIVYAGKVLKAVVTQEPPSGERVEEVDMARNASAFGEGDQDDRTMEAYDRVMKDAVGSVSAASAGGPSLG